jgi:hypothetical protein
MPKRTPQDWEPLEEELHAAGVTAEEIQAGHAGCWPRTAGTSSPRPASSSAWRRKTLLRRSG